jgi:hypothetical protein
MGLGDWIMATADAKEVNERHNVRVVFGDGRNKYWSEVFDNNPRIAKELRWHEQFAWVKNYPGHRPYIKEILKNRYVFNDDFKAKPGELFIKDIVKNDFVIIEPNVKKQLMLGPNKDWGMDNWKSLVSGLDQRGVEWRQMGMEIPINRDNWLRTKSFMHAARVLGGAKLLITTDGALHHAAAALNIPAIVLWGGVAHPRNLGYESHINIHHGDEPCGSHSVDCPHCRKAMQKITIDEVLERFDTFMKPKRGRRRGNKE